MWQNGIKKKKIWDVDKLFFFFSPIMIIRAEGEREERAILAQSLIIAFLGDQIQSAKPRIDFNNHSDITSLLY